MSITSEADGRGPRDVGHVVHLTLERHGVGRAIHERPSVPNHVLTIEPVITAGSNEACEDEDGWTIRTLDGSLAAHHEPTLVLTAGEPVLLTAA